MMQHINAYFKTEDDAESARARLETVKTSDIVVEEMGGHDKELTFFPIQIGVQSQGMTGLTNADGFPGVAENDATEKNVHQDASITHHLMAQVDELDYEKAMTILHESGGLQQKTNEE